MAAGIARTLTLALFAALLLAVPAGAASTGISPLRASVPQGLFETAGGTDVYWISQRKSTPEPKIGYTYTSSLMRTSFLDGSKSLVKKFDPTDTDTGFPETVLAGGGYVYVNLTGDGPDRSDVASSSTVLRMASDGSNPQKVAHGQSNSGEEDTEVREHGKWRLNDCGTTVSAELVTNDGSAVIRETTSERESKLCGRKKNVDRVRFYLLSPTGTVREIVTSTIRIKRSDYLSPGGFSTVYYGPDDVDYARILSVVGDRALFARPGSASFFVRDLNTGAESGPYKTGLTGRYPFSTGTLDPLGRVAVSTYAFTGARNHPKFKWAQGVFQTPGSTVPFAKVKGQAFLIFCGSHLVALTGHGINELDPVTLNLIRPIAPQHKDGSAVWLNNACSNDYLYMNSSRGKNTKYLAYPLN